MFKIILDPNLFECEANASEQKQMEHFVFLKKCVAFLAKYCNVCLDVYDGAPYFYKTPDYPFPPITKSRYLKINYNQIIGNLQKIQNSSFNYIDITKALPCKAINNMNFIDNSECKDSFFRYMNYARAFEESLIILGMNNKCNNVGVIYEGAISKNIDAIWNLTIDCSNRVHKLLIPTQGESDPFKYKLSCQDLNDAFKKENNPDISIMQKYGKEFASRNHYIKDNSLSKKNPAYLVFANYDRKYVISIDQEHGGIELFMKTGSGYEHLGEYDYSGNKTKDAQPENHKLNS